MILCCLLVSCCCRCFTSRGGINYDVDEANPDWDVDQLRVYQIRRLQRQLAQNRNALAAEAAANLERQLKEQEEENANEFLAALEDVVMDSKSGQQFEIADCVICLDPMIDGQMMQRVPTCKHMFHPGCLKEWFTSKAQADEQRCPQCNQVLKTTEMKAAKAKNQANLPPGGSFDSKVHPEPRGAQLNFHGSDSNVYLNVDQVNNPMLGAPALNSIPEQ